MKKQTVVDQIEIRRDGAIHLRFAKQVVDDDGTVLSSEWHRTPLPPGTDIDAQMAMVNASLVRDLKVAAVDASELSTLKAVAPVVWTKEVLTTHAEKVAKAEAALVARSQAAVVE